VVAFIVCDLLGIPVAVLLPHSWAPYDSVLFSYNLFLAWLLISGSRKTGISLPILSTILTHLACLALITGLTIAFAHGPSYLDFCLAGMAVFERYWIFNGKEKNESTDAALPSQIPEATVDDQEAFRDYLTQEDRRFRRPGRSVDEEFSFWLADRVKKKAEAAASALPDGSG
jgi:hypothetical protein